jgi:muconolactone delta-isomerase
MALYFVTMDIEKPADPRLPVGRLANILREAILPSVEDLIPLRAQGMLITGGYLVGEGTMVFVFEADSEEEVRKVLEGLPLSGVATTKVRRMRALGELHTIKEQEGRSP